MDPRAANFYSKCSTLGLSEDDIAAIKDAIVDYQVQTAIASGKRTAYTAPWEVNSPRQYIADSKYAPKPQNGCGEKGIGKQEAITVIEGEHSKAEEMMAGPIDLTDPLGLGLESLSISKGKNEVKIGTDGPVNLMD